MKTIEAERREAAGEAEYIDPEELAIFSNLAPGSGHIYWSDERLSAACEQHGHVREVAEMLIGYYYSKDYNLLMPKTMLADLQLLYGHDTYLAADLRNLDVSGDPEDVARRAKRELRLYSLPDKLNDSPADPAVLEQLGAVADEFFHGQLGGLTTWSWLEWETYSDALAVQQMQTFDFIDALPVRVRLGSLWLGEENARIWRVSYDLRWWGGCLLRYIELRHGFKEAVLTTAMRDGGNDLLPLSQVEAEKLLQDLEGLLTEPPLLDNQPT